MAAPQWTEAECVRAIESELQVLRVAAMQAHMLAEAFEGAANGRFPLSELASVVRPELLRLLRILDETSACASPTDGPYSTTRHRA